VKVLIGGDFCPIGRAEQYLLEGRNILNHSILKIIENHDAFIANLECPITDLKTGILKSGPHLKSNPEIVHGLPKMNISALSLANNHTMDYGEKGLVQTVDVLKDCKIPYFGCMLKGIGKPYHIFDKDNIKVGVLSFSNFEFSTYKDFNLSGTWPIDVVDILRLFKELMLKCDHIIILLHAGLYKFPLPYPGLKKLCRFLIEHGARAVLCQHSHICGAYEFYEGGFISYGQGSFVFDLNRPGTHWEEGYLVSIDINEDKMDVDILGLKQFGKNPSVRLMSPDEQLMLTKYVKRYNKALDIDEQYKYYWSKYLSEVENLYFGNMLLWQSKWIRIITRRLNLGKLIPVSIRRTWLNMFRNDEHREVIQALIKRSLND